MSYVFPLPDWLGAIGLHWGSDKGAADLFAPAGTAVRAVTSGVVTYVATSGLGGNAVQIRGDDGLDYYYAHFRDAPLVTGGQRVSTGQRLGAVGTTGNADGTPPHLHIGIGHGIASGSGPHGGAGAGFDAVAFLTQLLAGQAPTGVTTGRPATPNGPPATGGGGPDFGSLFPAGVWTRAAAVSIGAALLIGGLTLAFLSSDAGQAAIRGTVKAAKVAAVA